MANRFSAFLIAAILCAPPAVAPARAATAADTAQAKDHFSKGSIHYDLKEYEEALQEFKDAYRYVQDSVFLFNIAQCHAKLGHRKEAVDFYRSYLRRAPNPPNRIEVEKRIAEIEKEMSDGTAQTPPPVESIKPPLVIAPPPPPPRVDHPVPPPPTAAEPASTPTATPAEPAVDLTASTTSTPAETDASTPFYGKWWFWTGIGVIAVGVTAAILAGSGGGEVGDCMGLPKCITVSR